MKDFDDNPDILGVANGVIDLRTGKRMPHGPQHMLTRISPVRYDPKAKCPMWEKALAEIFEIDPHVTPFLPRVYGYGLTGHQREKRAFFFVGSEDTQTKNGDNAKSFVLNFLDHILGSLSVGISTKHITEQKNGGPSIPNDVASLYGARVARGSEFKRTDVLSEEKLKELTGNEKTKARFLNKEFFDFKNRAKIMFATNYLPLILGRDDAIWNRITIIPFRTRFYDADKCPPGGKIVDRDLEDKIVAKELPGILAWAVRGAMAWYRDGLQVPAEIQALRDVKHKEFDQLADWTGACVEADGAAVETASDLWASYSGFCRRNGTDGMTSTAFGRALTDRGVKKDDSASQRMRCTIRRGVRLTDAGRAYAEGKPVSGRDANVVPMTPVRSDEAWSVSFTDGTTRILRTAELPQSALDLLKVDPSRREIEFSGGKAEQYARPHDKWTLKDTGGSARVVKTTELPLDIREALVAAPASRILDYTGGTAIRH